MTVSETEAHLPRPVRSLYDLFCDAIRTGVERDGATLH
jgi:hypothetical protein